MSTYIKIQEYVKKNHNVVIKSCWVADVKYMYGLNRVQRTTPRKYPCPPDLVPIITEAFKHFKMIPDHF